MSVKKYEKIKKSNPANCEMRKHLFKQQKLISILNEKYAELQNSLRLVTTTLGT